MDWNAIGTEVILSIIGVVLTGLGTLITFLINKYVKNAKVKDIILSLNDLVKNSVLEVYQTYVEALKKDGMFDKKAQEEALNKCLTLIQTNISKDVQEWLSKNVGDVTTYLKSLIEATIGLLKNTGTK